MRYRFKLLMCAILFLQPVGAWAQLEPTQWPAPTQNNSSFSTGSANPQSLQVQDEFLPVEQAYILNTEFEGVGKLRLNWQIADAYYLYRHSYKFKLLDGSNAVELSADIGAGKAKHDEYFGDVEVYYHNADVSLSTIPQKPGLILSVTSQGCADAGLCYPPRTQYFELNGQQLTSTEIDKPAAITTASAPPISPEPETGSLLYMLLLALLGGAFLNLMPCVFPVLSLKVLGFAKDKEHSQALHGVAYSVGVVVSFIIVAAVLVSLQAAGEAIGWGFHLQSPWFVASLTYLFFVMGLSLSGFIEFGSQWMNVGGRLADRSGYTGSFFTGVLATVVASPCTAPLMGTALGYAVTQPTFTALSVFATLGLGMALPVLLLSFSPKLLNKIPRPGPWMETLKQALAFPLYATAVWLAWVVGNQTGVNGMAALLLGCVLITLALWLWRRNTFSRCLSAACVAAAIAIVSGPLLTPSTHTGVDDSDKNWQAYTPQTLSELRSQGKPVFINITADWCITCLANERVSLGTEQVKKAMIDNGVTYLKGDWTNHNPQITELLRQYGRTGIPLYLAYPAGNNQPGTVLPQILTSATVIEALEATRASLPQQ